MIRLIAAIDRRRGIAKHGFIPWYLPQDEAYFTEKTKTHGGQNLIGSATFKTFSQGPLAGRQNYVLTHSTAPIEGATVVNDLAEFMQQFQDRDLWVVGGADVFAQVMAMGRADELYLTHIEADFGCDRFFPEYSDGFKQTRASELREENGFLFTYATYVKA